MQGLARCRITYKAVSRSSTNSRVWPQSVKGYRAFRAEFNFDAHPEPEIFGLSLFSRLIDMYATVALTSKDQVIDIFNADI